MISKHDLGERIQSLRGDAGLSQQDLARACGIARATLSGIENGHHEPGALTVVALASALHKTTDEVLGVPAPAPADILPGWGQLTTEQQTLVRQMVSELPKQEPLKLGDSGRASEEAQRFLASVIPDPDEFDTLDEWLEALPEVTRRSVTAALDMQSRSSSLRAASRSKEPPSGGADEASEADGDREGRRGSAG